ncbi:MAG: N-methyl-L-tryptophan oxidase [Planctomycetia bacterium]|nr:N-methyl-L-tryptophan oxidase [Planctomycetia bacterium]
MRRFDAIVVGLGGIGSAAAFHLAARGCRVLGLDRFPIAHDRGSSHGQTRLIRLAYFEHPDYVPLLRRGYELWRDLEARTGRRLLVESGLMMAGPSESDVIRGAIASAETHGLALARLSAAEACRRWPQFVIPAPWTVLHEEQAGYLFVEECVAAHAAAAAAAGATLETDVRVGGWRTERGGVVVTTEHGDITADRLVLAPGPWADSLLHLPAACLTVLRKSLFWYRPPASHAHAFAAGALPCFAFAAPHGFFYGFPTLDARGVKIAEHSGGRVVADPLHVDRAVDMHEQRRIDEVIAAHLPTLGTTVADHVACLYTMSPDHHFLVGLHPDHDRVAIAAGFSGHGFKFASVMGEAIADLALSGTTPLPLGFLSPSRFC